MTTTYVWEGDRLIAEYREGYDETVYLYLLRRLGKSLEHRVQRKRPVVVALYGLVHIKVNGEEIITTPIHPFWVPEKSWTDTIQLRAGDRLQLLNGEYVIVEQVQHEILEAPVTVYNFEIEDFHTYYVSDSAILVHNACKPTSPNQQKQVKSGLRE